MAATSQYSMLLLPVCLLEITLVRDHTCWINREQLPTPPRTARIRTLSIYVILLLHCTMAASSPGTDQGESKGAARHINIAGLEHRMLGIKEHVSTAAHELLVIASRLAAHDARFRLGSVALLSLLTTSFGAAVYKGVTGQSWSVAYTHVYGVLYNAPGADVTQEATFWATVRSHAHVLHACVAWRMSAR